MTEGKWEPQPGWYDTGVEGVRRYWDGAKWTDNVESLPLTSEPYDPDWTPPPPPPSEDDVLPRRSYAASEADALRRRGWRTAAFIAAGLTGTFVLGAVLGTVGANAPTTTTVTKTVPVPGPTVTLTTPGPTVTVTPPPPPLPTRIEPGTYVVGLQLQPGTYVPATAIKTDACYYAVVKKGGSLNDPNAIVTSSLDPRAPLPPKVSLRTADQVFYSENCGPWKRVGD